MKGILESQREKYIRYLRCYWHPLYIIITPTAISLPPFSIYNLFSHPPCCSYSQCVLATTMCKQTQIACLYAEIVEDIKTRNSECTDIWYDKMVDTTMRRQPQQNTIKYEPSNNPSRAPEFTASFWCGPCCSSF
jgi:hypothetical protein